MDGAGQDLLAGTAFAQQQHRIRGGGGRLALVDYGPNLGAFADKVLKRVVALKAGPYKIFRLHFGDIAQLDLGQVLGQVAHQLLADIVHIGVAQHAQGPHHAALPEDGVDVLQTAAALNHIELVFDGRAGAQHLLEGGYLIEGGHMLAQQAGAAGHGELRGAVAAVEHIAVLIQQDAGIKGHVQELFQKTAPLPELLGRELEMHPTTCFHTCTA